jgi:hypothetical protein
MVSVFLLQNNEYDTSIKEITSIQEMYSTAKDNYFIELIFFLFSFDR